MEWTAETYRSAALARASAAQDLAAGGLSVQNSADVFLLCGIAAEAFLRSISNGPNAHRSDHRLAFWLEETRAFVGDADAGGSIIYLAKAWRSSDRFLGTDDLRQEVKRRTGAKSRSGERIRSDGLIQAARLALTAVKLLSLLERP